MIDLLSRTALARWDDLKLPGPRPARLTFLVDTADDRRHGCARFRAFRDGDAQPIFRGKIPRDGVARRELLAEHETLRALAEVSPVGAGRLFPRPLFLHETGATAETILPGRAPSDPGTALAVAGRWLGTLWRATEILEGADPALHEPYLRATLASAERTPPGGPQRLLERFAEELERRGGTSRCAFGHGSLEMSRLRVSTDGAIGTIDWEAGGRRCPTWSDPVTLALDAALRGQAQRVSTETDAGEAFRAGFLSDAPLAQAIRAFLAAAFERGGVPPEEIRIALPATALLRARHAEHVGDRDPGAWSWRAIALASLAADTADRLVERLGAQTSA